MHKFKDFNPDLTRRFSFDKFISEKDTNKQPDIQDASLTAFYKTLEDAVAAKKEIKQESFGSMKYSKEVENIQAALNFLGYNLPKYGVDGLFGPETGAAVAKFKKDFPVSVKIGRAILEAYSDDLIAGVNKAGGEIKAEREIDGGGDVSRGIATIIPNIVKSIEDLNINVKLTSGNDEFHQGMNSRHAKGEAVDFTISPNTEATRIAVEKVIRNFMAGSPGLSYINEYDKPSAHATGGHFHVSYRANDPENSGIGLVGSDYVPSPVKIEGGDIIGTEEGQVITPNFIKALIGMLKKRNFGPNDIKNYVKKENVVALTSAEDEEFYKGILKSIGANVTDEKMTFLKAWRQAEGGRSRNNPFNTTKDMPIDGVSNYNSVGVKNYPTRQAGLEATVKTLMLPYYKDLVAKLKNDNITATDLADTDDLSTWGTGSGVSRVLAGGKVSPPPIYA
jgi:peptidoglycan hydrolase-like protein with peptidoglycan-binding domain